MSRVGMLTVRLPMDTPFDPVMSRINYRHLRPPEPVTDHELHAFEQQVGHPLPPGFRLFLVKYGLTAGKNDVRFTNQDNPEEVETSVDVFYGFKAGYHYDIRDCWETYSEDLPGHLLPFATGSGGQFLLSLAGDDQGTVYWWLPEYGPVESTDDLEPVADSFDQFVNSLVSVEE